MRALVAASSRVRLLVLVGVCVVSAAPTAAQTIADDRTRGARMLRAIKDELKIRYVDPSFNGRDIERIFADAASRIEQAGSQAEVSAHLAAAVMALDDSHTLFVPPPQPVTARYGFILRMVGDRCFVADVDPAGPAFRDGLRPGMEVLAVQSTRPSRGTLWQIDYSLQAIQARREVRFTVRTPAGAEEAKVVRPELSAPRQFQRFEDWASELVARLGARPTTAARVATVSSGVAVAQLGSFNVPEATIDAMMRQVRGASALVLDLRGNAGGAVDTLKRLAGYFATERATIGRLMTRKGSDDLVADRRPPDQVFTGKVAVLVDSASASASEVLARALQLSKRAIVLGDTTAGAVMVSRQYFYQDGHAGRFVVYGLGISDARLLMNDGSSLEHVGVTPDELVLPSAADLAEHRDPALARAVTRLGGTLDAAAAGAVMPREWR